MTCVDTRLSSLDMQLDATEFIRRAERGLGVAIREGQARGEIETPSEGKSRGGWQSRSSAPEDRDSKPKPTDFAKPQELSGPNRETPGIYAMTDNVTDAEFEDAIAESRGEGNVSRANVARKAKAKAHPKESVDADDLTLYGIP